MASLNRHVAIEEFPGLSKANAFAGGLLWAIAP